MFYWIFSLRRFGGQCSTSFTAQPRALNFYRIGYHLAQVSVKEVASSSQIVDQAVCFLKKRSLYYFDKYYSGHVNRQKVNQFIAAYRQA